MNVSYKQVSKQMKIFKLMKRGADKVLASKFYITGTTRTHSENRKVFIGNDEYQVEFGKEDIEQVKRLLRQLEQL